ncbi:MAG: single-stranded DNA-binding protein [Clostridia bacterium]|nr:single-stranded DNA-binding protein [Clostridia bacterium]
MNYELMNNNVATLCGVVATEPVFSHEMYGEGFYESVIIVPRLSDSVDKIPFTVSERLLVDGQIAEGNTVTLVGQLRSYNKITDGKSKLLLTLFVRDVVENDEEQNPNVIDVTGYVCKPPVYRMTPFKREICDILLAVNRAYNKSDYLPCIAWGRNARYVKEAAVGTKLTINGRIQSREYQKVLEDGTTETRVAYEVSVNRISDEE